MNIMNRCDKGIDFYFILIFANSNFKKWSKQPFHHYLEITYHFY